MTEAPRTTSHRVRFACAGGLLLSALVGLATAHAQGVYRIVGPDGKVTFSDLPPPDAKGAAKVTSAGMATETRPPLPFELQQLVAKYPVTLYTAQGCHPCDSGRQLLATRGIPYTEKTVNTPEDVTAFLRINTENTLPLLLIGGQRVKGFSASEWGSYLDAAGYPQTSSLPPSYRQPAALPLVPLKTAAEAPSQTPSAAPSNPSHPPQKPATSPSNPAGIRF